MIKLLYIVILFMLWAFFAGSETAFISASRFKLNNLRKKGRRRASIAYFLLERPERLLGTSLVGTNISLVLSANITAILLSEIFGKPQPLLSIAILTVASLLCCEIIPKNIAIKKSLKITLISALPMYIFYFIFFPIGKLFTFITMGIMRISGISYTGSLPSIFKRREDVEVFLKTSLKSRLSEDESRYFVDSLDFGMKDLSAIMIPLVDIKALPYNQKIRDCLYFIKTVRKAYIPVYKDRIDNIIGVIYAQDIIHLNKNLSITEVMQKPIFAPESKNINMLYKELHEKEIPIVFTVDEWGGITGMSTIYDIGEEVIGKITGFEDKKSLIVQLKKGEYLCDGEVEIDEISDKLSIAIEHENVITLNGLLSNELGRIPQKGDSIKIAGYVFTVERSTKTKAQLIKISAVN
ncbi:MAG: HlyC/CorC family transporter [Spirochaetota bacterium]|nr:MAG: HlyC/CorC family transporter [Spirochaetota bacterium]